MAIDKRKYLNTPRQGGISEEHVEFMTDTVFPAHKSYTEEQLEIRKNLAKKFAEAHDSMNSYNEVEENENV